MVKPCKTLRATPAAANFQGLPANFGLEEQQVPNAISFDAGTHHPRPRIVRSHGIGWVEWLQGLGGWLATSRALVHEPDFEGSRS